MRCAVARAGAPLGNAARCPPFVPLGKLCVLGVCEPDPFPRTARGKDEPVLQRLVYFALRPMPAKRVTDQTGQHRRGGEVTHGTDLIDRYATERHERRFEAQDKPTTAHDATAAGRLRTHSASSAKDPVSDRGTAASAKHM